MIQMQPGTRSLTVDCSKCEKSVTFVYAVQRWKSDEGQITESPSPSALLNADACPVISGAGGISFATEAVRQECPVYLEHIALGNKIN